MEINSLISDAKNLLNEARQQLAAGNAAAAQQSARQALDELNQAKTLQAQLNADLAAQSAQSQKQLPQTGNSTSNDLALAGLGAVMATATLGLAAKKRHE